MNKPEHARIWLEPQPGSDPDGGRLWCQDKVWDDGVEYVRASALSSLQEENERLRADLLRFGEMYDAEDKRVDAEIKALEHQWSMERDLKLEYVEAMKSAEARAIAAEQRQAEAVRVLEPFAAFLPLAEGFVQARAEQGGSPILPTKHFSLADFRAARSFIATKEGKDNG